MQVVLANRHIIYLCPELEHDAVRAQLQVATCNQTAERLVVIHMHFGL